MTSPAVPDPGQRGRYIPALDGLRGVSLPGTIFTHFGIFFFFLPTAPGWLKDYGPFTLNIEMFFVLSGALITSLLVREFQRKDAISLKNFYLRRSRRLGPALIVIVPVLLAVQLIGQDKLLPPLGSSPWVTSGLILIFMGNWRLFTTPRGLGWLGPAWTLGIEEQFYLTWPLVLYLAMRKGMQRREVLTGIAIITLICVAGTTIAEAHFRSGRTFYMTPTQIPPIFVGCALGYELTMNPDGRLARLLLSRLVGLAGLAGMVVISITMWDHQKLLGEGGYLIYGLASALLIGHTFVVVGKETFISRFFSWKPFVIIGQVSYEAYLVHVVVILTVFRLDPTMRVTHMMALDVVLITVVSGLFYYCIERPIRRRGWRRAFVRDRAAAVTAGAGPSGLVISQRAPQADERAPAAEITTTLVTSDYGNPLK